MPQKASGGVRPRMVNSTEDEACFQSPLRAACENCYWFYRHRWRRDMRRRGRVDASVGDSTRPRAARALVREEVLRDLSEVIQKKCGPQKD
jgi:hypothetical protein